MCVHVVMDMTLLDSLNDDAFAHVKEKLQDLFEEDRRKIRVKRWVERVYEAAREAEDDFSFEDWGDTEEDIKWAILFLQVMASTDNSDIDEKAAGIMNFCDAKDRQFMPVPNDVFGGLYMTMRLSERRHMWLSNFWHPVMEAVNSPM